MNTNWRGGTRPTRRQERAEQERREAERHRRHLEKKHGWNPNGVDPEPGFPVGVLERQSEVDQ